jgi:serine phosphatase RsbU (regulator of sigma subunit)
LFPGDKLLLYTDGLPHAAAGPAGAPTGLLAAAVEHRDLPIAAFVERLSQDLLAQEPQPDDFTLLGVEVLAR